MNTRVRIQILVMVAALVIAFGAALPAAAATTAREPAPIVREYDPGQILTNDRASDPVIWAVFGIAAGCAIGGVLYFLKREVGGFPENPDWVAPISVLRSADSAVEPEDYPKPPAGEHH